MPVSSEAIFEIKQTLLDAIDNDTLNLPTLPEVAVEIRKVASSPDAAVKDLCKVLETDPTVAASVIKVANSPLFRGNGKIDNLRAAATRLGTRYTANFATGVAMRQLFNAKSPFINQLMVETWNISTSVAASAQVQSRLHPRLYPDRASLAGLTHRIGVLPILSYAENSGTLIDDPAAMQQLIDVVHQDVGTRILEAWQFPDDLINVPCDYLLFERDIPEPDYADLVTVAILLDKKISDAMNIHVDFDTVKAFERLGIAAQQDGDEDQAQMIEHIEIAAAAFG